MVLFLPVLQRECACSVSGFNCRAMARAFRGFRHFVMLQSVAGAERFDP
jgi:hypothetical protein